MDRLAESMTAAPARPRTLARERATRSLFETGNDFAGVVLGGTYELGRPLAAGGMSVVYEARHLRLGHRVAVKLMARCLVADRHALGRFRREAELLSQLHHPHVVQVIDFATTPAGEPYLVMELLEGEGLDERLRMRGRLPVEEVTRIIEQIASALALAHSRAILHRDLKPSNVFLERLDFSCWHAKLLDFGISKDLTSKTPLTQEFTLVGTPEYMAPEQAFGRASEIDHRADQYALALMAYEALSGTRPFWRDDPILVLEAVRQGLPPDLRKIPDLSPRVSAVIERGMAKDPAHRYRNVSELAQALRAAVSGPTARSAMSEQPTLPGIAGPLSATDAERIVEATRTALEHGDLDAACKFAHLGTAALRQGGEPRAVALLELSVPLFEHVFAARVGGSRRRLRAASSPAPAQSLSPAEAFLLSRADDALSVEDLLDVAALPRPEALRSIARLLDLGLLADGQT
jgi:serine/threonine protein kinase